MLSETENVASIDVDDHAHPIVRYRGAVAAAWRDVVREIGPSYRRMGQSRLRERIDDGIVTLIDATLRDDYSSANRFLSSLEWVVDQERMSVEDVIAGLLGGHEALDRAIPPEERYTPLMIASDRVLRALVARFAASAVQLVTEKLEIEASLQRSSRARLMALQRVGAAVTSSLDLDSTLETIVREAADLMGGATARLRLADESDQHLYLIASAGETEGARSNAAVPVETTLAGLCYRSGRPVISNDVASDPRANPDILERFQTRSLLSVPLLVRGRAIGVLTISNLSERPFEEADSEMLSLFADHAAVAIENGRLFQEAQTQITEMEILNRVSAVVSSSLNPSSIYRSIHEEIARIMVADAFMIMLRNADGGFDLNYIVDLGNTFAPRHNVAIPPIYLRSMDERRPFIVEASHEPNFGSWERYGDMTRRVQSLIVAPLTRGDEAIGVITAQSYAQNSFRQRDADLLATVANVAAVAIENARLYEQSYGVAVAEERNRLAREIHDTIAQGLVGIILQLEAVAAQLDSDSPLLRRVERSIGLARANLDEARRSVRDLRAAPLEHLSLTEALQQLVDQHKEDCEGEVVLIAPSPMPMIEKNVESAIFRFVQESLTNCRKYARDVNIWIVVEVGPRLTVSVRDAGPGFDVEAWRREKPLHRFGLHGMRERAERLGGSFDIESERGRGTRTKIEFPMEVAAALR